MILEDFSFYELNGKFTKQEEFDLTIKNFKFPCVVNGDMELNGITLDSTTIIRINNTYEYLVMFGKENGSPCAIYNLSENKETQEVLNDLLSMKFGKNCKIYIGG